jgi:hypothetical protein
VTTSEFEKAATAVMVLAVAQVVPEMTVATAFVARTSACPMRHAWIRLPYLLFEFWFRSSREVVSLVDGLRGRRRLLLHAALAKSNPYPRHDSTKPLSVTVKTFFARTA